MKRFPAVLILLVFAGCLSGCAETDTKPGSALSIEHQDTTTAVPGNSPIVDRMRVDGGQPYHRKVTTMQ